MTDELVKLLRAQLQAKEDGLNVRDRRIEAQAAEIARLRGHIGIIRDEAERPNSTWPHIKRVIGNASRAALGGKDE